MLIDFHTHIFPDKIAKKTMEILTKPMAEYKGGNYTPYTNGTLSDLKRSMSENNVDISVVLPVVTSPKQTASINEFARSVASDNIIAFGGIYPGQKDWEDVLYNISESGLKGVKLHPEFQSCYVDSPDVIKIIKKAEDLGLYVSIHTGTSIGCAPPLHCSPKMLRNVLRVVSGENIIGAHMGGWDLWEDTERYLAGTPILMDISFVRGYLPKDLCMRIFEKHGIDKILYGSDSPWESQSDSLTYLDELGLSRDEKDLIKYKNALRVLDLKV